jgi:hypothetical protein
VSHKPKCDPWPSTIGCSSRKKGERRKEKRWTRLRRCAKHDQTQLSRGNIPESLMAATADIEMANATTSAAQEPDAPKATETLYIQNLNERIKLPSTFLSASSQLRLTCRAALKATLRNLFSNYGDVLDVVAHSNVRMRGQAFVSFDSPEIAAKAQREANRFPLYSKPMVCLIIAFFRLLTKISKYPLPTPLRMLW